ncbi:MAG: uncharacterized membrane protein YbhN (UPF0104 family) [Flavobacteriaceae bacterium]
MLKTNKNQKILFFSLKVLLFFGVLYLLYKQLSEVDESTWGDFKLANPWALIVAVLLIYPNIWVAYVKWKVTLNVMNEGNDRSRMIQSFFAGIVMGMVTPNMIGNFIGRFYYFDKEHRSTITILTLFSNFAQLMATLIFGTLSVLIVGEIYMVGDDVWLIALLISGGLVSFFMYFFADRTLYFFRKRLNIYRSRELLKKYPIYRVKMIGYSMLRFIIFTLQFSLVMYAFGEEYTIDLVLAIWQVYMITLMIPSLFFGKLGVKEMVAVAILGPLGMNEFSILFTSLLIWFMNSLTPTLVGLVVCKRPEA